MAGVQRGKAGRRDLWRRSVQFRIGLRWYLIGIGLFVVIQTAQLIRVAAGGGEFVRPWYLEQPVALLANLPALLLLGPISEEYGWRGFALDPMLARWSRPLTNLILGTIWSLWHLPLFFISGTSQSQLGAPLPSFLWFTVQVIALTVIYTWFHRNTNGSVWSAIFLHFMTAFAAMIAGGLVGGGGSFIDPAAVITLVVIAAAVTVSQDLKRT